MLKEYFTDLKKFALLVGIIAGLVGVVGGWITLYDKWRNRKPKLSLWVPYNWTGEDIGAQKRFLALYLRISNTSNKEAYLYLETMSVSLKIKNNWYRVYLSDLPYEGIKETDFPERELRHFGIGKVKFLNRFEDNIVTFEKPLCGYVVVGYKDDSIFNESIDMIRLEVEDCHRKKHILYTDLEKQLESDPFRKYEEDLKKKE